MLRILTCPSVKTRYRQILVNAIDVGLRFADSASFLVNLRRLLAEGYSNHRKINFRTKPPNNIGISNFIEASIIYCF